MFHLPQVAAHTCKVRKENRGMVKGVPPFLKEPFVPFAMMPTKVNPAAIQGRVSLERQTQIQKEDNIPLIE